MTRPQVGDRVRVTGIMHDDPAPLPVGLEGTVTAVTPEGWTLQQYTVAWDAEPGKRPRTLMLLPHDPFVIVGKTA